MRFRVIDGMHTSTRKFPIATRLKRHSSTRSSTTLVQERKTCKARRSFKIGRSSFRLAELKTLYTASMRLCRRGSNLKSASWSEPWTEGSCPSWKRVSHCPSVLIDWSIKGRVWVYASNHIRSSSLSSTDVFINPVRPKPHFLISWFSEPCPTTLVSPRQASRENRSSCKLLPWKRLWLPINPNEPASSWFI